MSLRFALLALLTAQPMTGYDLAKAFHTSVGHVWHAPDSQIYPELRRMEEAGIIDGAIVPWGSKGTKTEYSITDAGELALRDWMSTPLEYARDRDPAHLRAAYFEWTDAESARAQLMAHRTHFSELRGQWEAQLTTILDRSHPVVARRLAKFPEADWDRIVGYKAFAYEGLIARASQEIEWAERGLILVAELAEPAEPAARDDLPDVPT